MSTTPDVQMADSSAEQLQNANVLAQQHRSNERGVGGAHTARVRPETSCDGRGWEKFPTKFAEAAKEEIYKLCGDPGSLPDLDILPDQSERPDNSEEKKPTQAATVDERVVIFLKKIDLVKHQSIFEKEEIDFDTLKEIKDEELEKLGIPFGPRKKIMKELAKGEEIVVPPKPAEPLRTSATVLGTSDRLKLKVSFQGWLPLRAEHEKMAKLSNEEMRERAKDVVTNVLDALMKVGWEKMSQRFVFIEVDLSHTMSSMRAIWKGKNGQGKKICRELEVVNLNLSFTVTSSRSVASLYLMKNLTSLYLDHCSSLKKTKKVFSLLLQKGVVPSLETLSVVGTSDVFAPDWLTQVESKCPKLKVVFFTRAPGTKALGWNDAILMQTMRNPVLLPCGHIGDRDVIKAIGHCSYDRKPFQSPDALIDLNPHITRLDKTDAGQWTAQVVDHARTKLDSKVLYHVLCGEFYNLATLKRVYDYKGSSVSAEAIMNLLRQPCVGCWRTFNSRPELRICFLHGAEDAQPQDFANLSELGEYSSEAEQVYPKYDPDWDKTLVQDD